MLCTLFPLPENPGTDTETEQYTPWHGVLPVLISNRSRPPCPQPCFPTSSSYLAGLYLIIKMLYIFNSTGQLFLTARFLGHTSIFYGLYMLGDLMTGDQWQRTGNFPRVTFCDFDMRRMGSNYHRHTLQCVLSINMFNEKIFIFLWFWLMLITVLNFDSFLRWCCKSTFEANRVSFIRNLLVRRNVIGKGSTVVAGSVESSTPTDSFTSKSSSQTTTLTDTERKDSRLFSEHVLGQDGVFVLRLISLNVGCHVASQVAESIWSRYVQAGKADLDVGGTTARSIMPLPPLPARLAQPALPVRRRRDSSRSADSNRSLDSEPVGPDRSPPVNTFSRRRFPRARQQQQQHHDDDDEIKGGSRWSSSDRDNRSELDSFGNGTSNLSYQDNFV